MTISAEWVDPDDAPELGSGWFETATVRVNGAAAPEDGEPRSSAKEQVVLRLDSDVVAFFRAGGPGWQTRINEALRAAAQR